MQRSVTTARYNIAAGCRNWAWLMAEAFLGCTLAARMCADHAPFKADLAPAMSSSSSDSPAAACLLQSVPRLLHSGPSPHRQWPAAASSSTAARHKKRRHLVACAAWWNHVTRPAHLPHQFVCEHSARSCLPLQPQPLAEAATPKTHHLACSCFMHPRSIPYDGVSHL